MMKKIKLSQQFKSLFKSILRLFLSQHQLSICEASSPPLIGLFISTKVISIRRAWSATEALTCFTGKGLLTLASSSRVQVMSHNSCKWIENANFLWTLFSAILNTKKLFWNRNAAFNIASKLLKFALRDFLSNFVSLKSKSCVTRQQCLDWRLSISLFLFFSFARRFSRQNETSKVTSRNYWSFICVYWQTERIKIFAQS